MRMLAELHGQWLPSGSANIRGWRELEAAPCRVAQATSSAEGEVLAALSRIIDPDFGQDIVACGFVRDLAADRGSGSVRKRLQLTTPACPVKAEFERQVCERV